MNFIPHTTKRLTQVAQMEILTTHYLATVRLLQAIGKRAKARVPATVVQAAARASRVQLGVAQIAGRETVTGAPHLELVQLLSTRTGFHPGRGRGKPRGREAGGCRKAKGRPSAGMATSAPVWIAGSIIQTAAPSMGTEARNMCARCPRRCRWRGGEEGLGTTGKEEGKGSAGRATIAQG